MRKNTNYVDASKFQTVIESRGIKIVPQAGFMKVSGETGRNLYVAKTKRVGRVDLSGFTYEEGGVIDLGGESFGNVKQQLDFSLSEDLILENFTKILDHMISLPAAEKQKRTAPMANKKDAAKGWAEHVPASSSPKDDANRLALIRKVAAEKGVGVSDKALHLSADDGEDLDNQ